MGRSSFCSDALLGTSHPDFTVQATGSQKTRFQGLKHIQFLCGIYIYIYISGMIFWLFVVIFLFLYGAKRGERTNFGVIPEGAKGGGQGCRKIAHTHTHNQRAHEHMHTDSGLES